VFCVLATSNQNLKNSKLRGRRLHSQSFASRVCTVPPSDQITNILGEQLQPDSADVRVSCVLRGFQPSRSQSFISTAAHHRVLHLGLKGLTRVPSIRPSIPLACAACSTTWVIQQPV
jgi:hypothetical protein